MKAYRRWQNELERQPVAFLGRQATDLLRQARSNLAQFLGTSANNLVFVTNATVGLNIVARSLKLSDQDEVLASDHEYGALDRTWRFLALKQHFKYINLPVSLPVTNPADFVEDLWRGVSRRTRVIFLSHITSPTALIFPVREICRRAREAGILTVIDGAHAPGQIPLMLDELGADFYSGNLHKWLCAPKGAAFLYARPEVQTLIEPLVVSWGWESETPSDCQFVDYLEWMGTRDLSPFLAVKDAIEFQETYRWDQVRERCHALAAATQKQIVELTGIPPLQSDPDVWFAQMMTAPLPPQTDLAWLKQALYDTYHIEVPLIRWNEQALIRVSFQGYNTQSDADRLIAALKRLLYSQST